MNIIYLRKSFIKLPLILMTVTLVVIHFQIISYLRERKQIAALNEKQLWKLKYILVWTSPTREPLSYLGEGQNTFLNRRCSVINCYVSSDRQLFADVSRFDVIIFHSSDLKVADLPPSRSVHQKYVFASMESADYYPIYDYEFNNYFNWTWTYKLNSDEQYGYISIQNVKGDIIGPKEVMHWKKFEEMKPISKDLEKKLSEKKIAAAWFASNCQTPSKREKLVEDLSNQMKKHGLTLDIYGHCGSKECLRTEMAECLHLLERDYYFYLSFENSFSPDYVTEKLLRPLQHYTVPIVLGGANYTRFMPKGIYLDARTMSTSQLAEKMARLINNKEEYYSYFKWHNYYSYHGVEELPATDPYCKLCSMINQRFEETSTYNDFSTWWST